jgi:DNA polymerase III epsilon subunit-like protein
MKFSDLPSSLFTRRARREFPVIEGPGYLVLDTETTGLHSDARVIELAVVYLDTNCTPQGGFSTLLYGDGYPGHPMACKAHGIRKIDLKRACKFEDMAPELVRALQSDRIPIAHNEGFDRRRLNYEFSRLDWPLLTKNLICTYALGRELGYGPMKLAVAADEFQLSCRPSHAAGTDAATTAELFAHFYERHQPQVVRHIKSKGYAMWN